MIFICRPTTLFVWLAVENLAPLKQFENLFTKTFRILLSLTGRTSNSPHMLHPIHQLWYPKEHQESLLVLVRRLAESIPSDVYPPKKLRHTSIRVSVGCHGLNFEVSRTNSEIHYSHANICHRVNVFHDEFFRLRIRSWSTCYSAIRELLQLILYDRFDIIDLDQNVSRLNI